MFPSFLLLTFLTLAAQQQGTDGEAKAKLSRALTLHASFDKGLDADFSRGDKKSYVPQGKLLVHAKPNEEVKLAADAPQRARAAIREALALDLQPA